MKKLFIFLLFCIVNVYPMEHESSGLEKDSGSLHLSQDLSEHGHRRESNIIINIDSPHAETSIPRLEPAILPHHSNNDPAPNHRRRIAIIASLTGISSSLLTAAVILAIFFTQCKSS